MRKKRYSLSKFAGVKHITDDKNGRVFAYGGGVELPTHQQHRMFYTDADAQAVVDMMNQRTIP